MDVFDNLNSNQQTAVRNEDRACLVNAQVGSGKTTVLIAKICFLHQFRNISLSDMVVLTFTNKAANEIKDRLKSADANITDDDLAFFGTFHSVAMKMLKTLAPLEKINYSADFAVMDADEKVDMANAIVNSQHLNIKYLSRIEKRMEGAAKGNYFFGNMKYPDDIQTLLNLYTQEKRTQGKMDFDDLIIYITQLLPEITYRPKWIIIDEFQDTDDQQMAFIHALASKDTKLFVVGDQNQIIYSWRGSDQRIFDRFSSEYDAKQLSLPENYRSCTSILEVAKCFLKKGTELNGIRDPGNKIKIRGQYDSFNEAYYIATSIHAKIAEGMNYSDIAVFYRLQRQSQDLENVFRKEGIPFEVSRRKTLKDIPVLKWIILLLRASVNPLDIESAIAVLSDDNYGEHLSKNIARRLVKASRDAKGNSAITSSSNAHNDVDETEAKDEESKLLLKINGFEEWCKKNNSVEDIYDYYAFNKYINPTSASFRPDKDSIVTLLKKIDDYVKAKKLDIYNGVKDFVNSSALYGIDVLSEDVKSDTNTVKLMTLHSAKGLEFKQVYIVGVNDGLIPLPQKNSEARQEERRLFFVGITRAKDFLELSYYTTTPDEGRIKSGPSRYIRLIPDCLRDTDGFRQRDVDPQKFRHKIQKSKATQKISIKKEPPAENIVPARRNVHHPKYGLGVIVNETDSMITVVFDGYGEKEFSKAFSVLKNVGVIEDNPSLMKRPGEHVAETTVSKQEVSASRSTEIKRIEYKPDRKADSNIKSHIVDESNSVISDSDEKTSKSETHHSSEKKKSFLSKLIDMFS